LIGFSIANGWFKNPIVYLRADISTLVVLFGSLITVLIKLWFNINSRWEKEILKHKSQIRSQFTEERRRFLKRLDHEVKNPLTAIQAGFANLTTNFDDEIYSDTLYGIQTQIDRLSHLMTDLRKLSALETREIEQEPIDLSTLLSEVLSHFHDYAEGNRQQITLTLPQAPWPIPTIIGDRDLIYLAIYNLLDNAYKFTRNEDTIEVRAYEDGSNVVVEVADTGPGIPEEEINLVWEELYRGQSTRNVMGSGLGLSLVRTIINRHGGKVALRSKEGEGTVVSIRLPIK
jgi:two-component system OmpR family sensor kinase